MKICHMCTGWPLSYQGGVTNYVRALAESQQNAGNEVWVIAEKGQQEYPYSVKNYKSEKIVPFRYRAMIDKQGLEELRVFLDEQQFDIIHIHMMMDVDWDLHEILKPYKYVVSLHDYFFLCPRIFMMQPDNTLCTQYDRTNCSECINWFNTVRLFNAVEWAVQNKLGMKSFKFPTCKQKLTEKRFQKYRKLLENADMLLPVSTRVQEIFENSGIRGNYKVFHIGNITADRFTPEFSDNRNQGLIKVVMLGSLNYYKGAEVLIKLAKHLDRSKFTIHFYGRSGEYGQKLQDAGIVDHGSYRQDELSEILRSSDIGCVLSVWEDNGPQVVMEMLNNHVPVVGTRMGGIPDFVNDGENGFLFDPYSDNDFERVVRVLNGLTKEDIFEMKKNIQPTMTTWKHAEMVTQAYNQVLMNQ